MTMQGIDISKYQAGIDLGVVPGEVVIVGTSDGSYINPVADAQVQAAKAAGKLVGVYHFFRNDPIVEAQFWASHTVGYQDGKTVFFLDAETGHPNLPALCEQFAAEFKRLTGIKVVIYTYWHLLQQYNWQNCVNADLGLWGAWYPLGDQRIDGYNAPSRQSPPYWGETLMGWQFTSAGYLPGWGDRLDLNEFYIDASGWYAYAAVNGVVAPAPTPAPVVIEKPAAKPAATVVSANQCIVEAGDSLSAIGAQFGVSWQDIASLNGIAAPYVIHPGQVLNLPGKSSAPAPAAAPRQCTVESGDSLSAIGAQFGVSWQAIADLNGIPSPYVIYPGQVLYLP